MDLQKNFSNSIKFIKASRNKSITDFSEELGIARSSLQTILKGDANPTIDTVEFIASRLQMDPLILLSTEKTYTDSAMLIAEAIRTVALLDNEQRQRFLTLFQEMVQLLGEVKHDV